MNSIKNITVIGTGNVALELCKLFLLNNFTIDAILGRKPFSDASLSSDLFTSNYKNIPSNSDMYLISVSDNSYEEILSQIKLKNPFIVHTSGSLKSSSLESNSLRWGCLYPLQTINKNRLTIWEQVPFYIEAAKKEDLSLLANVCSRNNLHYSIKNSNERNKMHIAAVIANNFTYYILSEVKEYCLKNNLQFHDLQPLIEKSIENILKHPPHSFQTGPAVRKDYQLIEKQLKVLENEIDLHLIYQILSKKILKKYQNEL